MTKKEKFRELVEQLANIGDEISEFLEAHRDENEENEEQNEEIDTALMGLSITIDEISELDIED